MLGNEGRKMKFVTENDLRDLYKKEPFTTYNLEPDARITPGARQFLADRGINMFDNDFGNKKKTVNIIESANISETHSNWRKLKLNSKMKSIEALFLLTGEELLSGDVGLAESVMMLNKQFSCIKNAIKNNDTVDNLCCNECNGINENNFSDNLDDCFEMTEIHIRLKKGRDILILHRLRCALQEIEPEVLEHCTSSSKEYEDVIGKVNQIRNSLSQLICSVVGGEKCQKQW
jgi:ethanolamine utilization cobalamin adenosyltransferase